MIRSYLSVALRSIARNKVFSFINIAGLGISMSVCLVIIMMVVDQYGYDKFHPHRDRIYRITTSSATNNSNTYATTPIPVREALDKDYSLTESSVIMAEPIGGDVIHEESIVPMSGYFTDGGFLKTFGFNLIKGSTQKALDEPYSVVLTDIAAEKLFGTADPVGKIVQMNDRGIKPFGITLNQKSLDLGTYTVSGILSTKGLKSHMRFDYLISLTTMESLTNKGILELREDAWKDHFRNYNYILLKEGKTEKDLTLALEAISEKWMTDQEDPKRSSVLTFQRMDEITPGGFINNMMSFRMPKIGLIVLMGLALVVMISACFNYTNLSIARSLTRAREIGIRKTIGAGRKQIFIQFIAEAVTISILALLFSVLLLQIIKPAFSQLWFNKYLQIELTDSLVVYGLFILFSILVGTIAGLLPSLYLSAFDPMTVLRAKSGLKLFRKVNTRKALIVAQFCISLFFIATAVTLHFQYRHIHKVDYGYTTENIINVPLYDIDYDRFARDLSVNQDIKMVSACQYILATGIQYGTEINHREKPETDPIEANYLATDARFIDNLEIKLLAGRGFDPVNDEGNEKHIIITETLSKDLGFQSPELAVGEAFLITDDFGIEKKTKVDVTIIGVTEDVQHQMLLENRSVGLFFRYRPSALNYANIRISGINANETIAFVESVFKSHDKTHLFEFEHLDQQLSSTYSLVNDIAAIIAFFSILAVSIACLGLLGMVVYLTETRSKEIGIRKAMGAETRSLVLLLGKGFFYLLGISIVISLPLAWVANNAWLEMFSSRVTFGPVIIGISLLIMAGLGALMILPQTLKSAMKNPVEVLRE